MAKKNFSEKEERDPLSLFIKKSNTFLSEYFWPIFSVLVGGVLIFGLSLLYSYWGKQQNQKAEELLYQARKELVLAEEKAGGDILDFNSSQNFFGRTKKAKYNSEMDKLANQYISVIKKWISKPVGLTAAAEMVSFLYQYEKKEQAMELVKEATLNKKKNMIGFLIAFQSGAYLMDQGDYDEAVKSFQFIMMNKKAEWLWPDTLVKIALCYEQQDKKEQAQEIYIRIKNDFSDSQASGTAEKYLNLLRIQGRMGKQVENKKTKEKVGE